MLPVVNIAAYKFAELNDLVELRGDLSRLCQAQRLRGTILVSTEGINLFVAGSRDGIDALLTRVRRIPGIADLEVKKSFSREQPFSRMLVKIKKEIIAFGVEGIAPGRYTSARLSPTELKQWLDEGRPVTLLDTRNSFEVRTGTFRNAVAIGVDDFRDFPAAVAGLPDELKRQPVVTFCTGGIRCEKAAPFLERAGFSDVYQLDGGILKYFQECDDAHYQGKCFVFDKRVALDANLNESDLKLCFNCQAALSLDDQAAVTYVEGKSCPHCFRSEATSYAELLHRRQLAIRDAMTPLPGSVPYDNVRPLSVPLRLDGAELLDFLDAMHTHLPRDGWIEACRQGRLVCRGETVRPGRMMRAGERLLHKLPATSEPDVASDISILHEDEAIVVVHKPAPLPMHPCGRYNRNTLSYVLEKVYAPCRPRPAHRLDADTSGVVVFSKTREIARKIQPQFENGDVRKTYIARVHGHPKQDAFECNVPISSESGARGIRMQEENGSPAHTLFSVLQRLEDGTSLLEVHPLTGRTNQIRVHLLHLGFPIVGDPMYGAMYEACQQTAGGKTTSITDPPLCLHAAAIEFVHPLTGSRTRYQALSPTWIPIEFELNVDVQGSIVVV
ncbi:MAG: RluA family pseudouridine synthase [Burkholderiales bacterium]|nr:RluA family pseudouridine synthase [Phycisphaerae bacterium]